MRKVKKTLITTKVVIISFEYEFNCVSARNFCFALIHYIKNWKLNGKD